MGKGSGRRTVYSELVEEAYICCEDYDFRWDKKQIPEFRELWNEGWSIFDIAKVFKRKPQEVLFLVIDQDDRKTIKKRPGGIWGIEEK